MATKAKLPAIVRRDQEALDERVRMECERARLDALRKAEIAARHRQAEWLRHSIDSYLEEADREEMLDLAAFLGLPTTPAPTWRSESERQRDDDLAAAADLEREAADLRARVARGAR